MKDIDSPMGIDLRPDPPTAVRLSKRAGIIGLIVVTAVIGLVGYGIVTRRQRTAEAMERGDPKSLTAVTDAGKVIAANIPAGVTTGRIRTDPGPPPSLAVRDLTPEERSRAAPTGRNWKR